MSIKVKRVYDPPEPDDGFRVLVDRLWPRGLSKSEAKLDLWLKDIAPSDELRKWFGHDPAKWAEFRRRYFQELDLDKEREAIRELKERARQAATTLLYAAKDEAHNNAAALKEYLERRAK